MSAAAELDRARSSDEHTDPISVFVAEERDGTELFRVGLAHLIVRRGDRGEHLGVHDVFDAGNLLRLSSTVRAAKCEKSNRNRCSLTSDPCCLT